MHLPQNHGQALDSSWRAGYEILEGLVYAFGAHFSIDWKQIPLGIRGNINLAQISL